MPLLVGGTPSQPGHFLILHEQRDQELSKSLPGKDSWYQWICKFPFPLPGVPQDRDSIIRALLSGETPSSPRSPSSQGPSHLFVPLAIFLEQLPGNLQQVNHHLLLFLYVNYLGLSRPARLFIHSWRAQ